MVTRKTSTMQVTIPAARVRLEAALAVPEGANGIVLFAHGSGSSRHSPRNARVAEALQASGIATLLFDLLSEPEAADRENVFDIPFLAKRLIAARDYVRQHKVTKPLSVGYFGASTGAAAALVAAAADDSIGAVVSRGGRPDLAGWALPKVKAPTLLIVGSDDVPVIRMNEEAFQRLQCEKKMEIVAGATHLFEEPGMLEEVMRLAVKWFVMHLGKGQ
jgi:dienelactone hydrolase